MQFDVNVLPDKWFIRLKKQKNTKRYGSAHF